MSEHAMFEAGAPQMTGSGPTSPYAAGTPGTKQRDLIRMTPAEIEEFILGERTLNVATINHDGTIHLVAMWFAMFEDCVAFTTKAKSQKIQNLRRDPRLTCLIEAGEKYTELRGVEMVGRAEIVEDPERLFALGTQTYARSSGVPYTEERRSAVEGLINKRVGVKIHVEKYVSWDHRKLT
jgi:PPOX class probable F420-dependent enzyme